MHKIRIITPSGCLIRIFSFRSKNPFAPLRILGKGQTKSNMPPACSWFVYFRRTRCTKSEPGLPRGRRVRILRFLCLLAGGNTFDTAFPTKAERERILSVVGSSDGTGRYQIESAVNIRHGRLEKNLSFLLNESALVKQGKYSRENRFSDKLVGKSPRLLRNQTNAEGISTVTCAPSLRSNLIPDFARRVAASAGLCFVELIRKSPAVPLCPGNSERQTVGAVCGEAGRGISRGHRHNAKPLYLCPIQRHRGGAVGTGKRQGLGAFRLTTPGKEICRSCRKQKKMPCPRRNS